jgi:hypothetical protein
VITGIIMASIHLSQTPSWALERNVESSHYLPFSTREESTGHTIVAQSAFDTRWV